MELTLTQEEKLELAAILGGGTADDMEADHFTPRIPQPSRALREYTARHGLRGGMRGSDDGGDTAPELDDEEEYEAAPRWQSHVLPSMRDRGSIRAELRGMGYGGEGW